jgi:hypothetical protein
LAWPQPKHRFRAERASGLRFSISSFISSPQWHQHIEAAASHLKLTVSYRFRADFLCLRASNHTEVSPS